MYFRFYSFTKKSNYVLYCLVRYLCSLFIKRHSIFDFFLYEVIVGQIIKTKNDTFDIVIMKLILKLCRHMEYRRDSTKGKSSPVNCFVIKRFVQCYTGQPCSLGRLSYQDTMHSVLLTTTRTSMCYIQQTKMVEINSKHAQEFPDL